MPKKKNYDDNEIIAMYSETYGNIMHTIRHTPDRTTAINNIGSMKISRTNAKIGSSSANRIYETYESFIMKTKKKRR